MIQKKIMNSLFNHSFINKDIQVQLPFPYFLRPLSLNDYHKGYFNLLSQLSSSVVMSYDNFVDIFESMKANRAYYIIIVEDLESNKIVGTATLMIEQKFIHNGGKVGHIEDVVVDKECRGLNLGKHLISQLKDIGKKNGIYKCILDCTQENVGFYEKCDFTQNQIQMQWRL